MTKQKVKMGRPPKPKAERKAETLTVRLTAAERRAAERAAADSGLLLTEWARVALVRAATGAP